MDNARGNTLLDILAGEVRCEFLSDLRYLSAPDRRRLARKVRETPAGAVSLREWNDALDYLAGAPPERAPEEAKGRLAELLSAME